MKSLKSKFATAFVLAGLMFGMLSFSTTPVAAQETDSVVATMEEDVAYARISLRAARWLGRAALAAGYFVVEGVTSLFGAEAAAEYPADSLDQ